jgi:hypothetical protein
MTDTTADSPVLVFPTADDRFSVKLNRDGSDCLLLETPRNTEVEDFLKRTEAKYIRRFWKNVLCAESPYQPNVPFGLAAFTGSLTLVDARILLRSMGKQHLVAAGRHVVSYLHLLPKAALISAINAAMPKSISEAHTCLSLTGLSRFEAFSLISLFDTLQKDFSRMVEHLQRESLTISAGWRFALMTLVAMRAKGWIVLSGALAARVADSLRVATKHRTWDDPLSYMDKRSQTFLDNLVPKSTTPRELALSFCRARYAVLCTNMRGTHDLSWNLATELLRKTASAGLMHDYTAAQRDHWRELCRENPRDKNDFRARVETKPQGGKGERGATWPEYPPFVPSQTSEIFHSAVEPAFSVVLNLDRNKPVIHLIPSPNELRSVLIRVETVYVSKYWDALAEQSPYNPQFPYALAGSSAEHTLIDPKRVVEELTGHRDFNSKEALEQLSRYSRSDLRFAIQRLRPKLIQEAFQILTENGRIRLQGFPLAASIERHQSFSAFLTSLVRIASSSGYQTNKALACHTLVAIRARGWISLTVGLCKHMGTVTRGVRAKGHAWKLDTFEFLDDGLIEMLNQIKQSIPLEGERVPSENLLKLKILLLCTNLRGMADLTMPLVDRVLDGSRSNRLTNIGRGLAQFRAACQQICMQNGPAAMLSPINMDEYRQRLILKAPPDPRLSEWINLLATQFSLHRGGNLSPLFTVYLSWLTWLSTLPDVPSPSEVTRAHISGTDGLSYREFLANRPGSTHHRNMCISKIGDVFERLVTARDSRTSC